MMDRRNMKRRRYPKFVMLTHPMMDSAAFNDLKPSAVVVLVSILRRHNGMNGTPGDPIVCPYSAMKCGMATSTIGRAIRELEAHGFIQRISNGGLEKNPNRYILTDGWKRWKKTDANKQNASTATSKMLQLAA